MTHKEDYEWKEREQFYEIYEGNRGAYLQVTVNQIRDDEADIRILCTFEPTMCTDDEVIRNAFQVGPSWFSIPFFLKGNQNVRESSLRFQRLESKKKGNEVYYLQKLEWIEEQKRIDN